MILTFKLDARNALIATIYVSCRMGATHQKMKILTEPTRQQMYSRLVGTNPEWPFFSESYIYEQIGSYASTFKNSNISSTSSTEWPVPTNSPSTVSSCTKYTRCLRCNEREWSRVRIKFGEHKYNVNTKETIIDTQDTKIKLLRANLDTSTG